MPSGFQNLSPAPSNSRSPTQYSYDGRGSMMPFYQSNADSGASTGSVYPGQSYQYRRPLTQQYSSPSRYPGFQYQMVPHYQTANGDLYRRSPNQHQANPFAPNSQSYSVPPTRASSQVPSMPSTGTQFVNWYPSLFQHARPVSSQTSPTRPVFNPPQYQSRTSGSPVRQQSAPAAHGRQYEFDPQANIQEASSSYQVQQRYPWSKPARNPLYRKAFISVR